MNTERLNIVLTSGASVSGEMTRPSGSKAASKFALLLAHGAGTDMHQAGLVAVADALAGRGHVTLRFNFLYKEHGGKAPDRAPVLEATVRDAAAFLRAKCPKQRIVLGGRSMGGRYASIAASKGLACDALVFLGYPLHPAGRPESLRDAHLPSIPVPMFFVQGSRDALCRLDLLRPVLSRIGERAHLHVVEGADHGLTMPKRQRTQESIIEEVARAIDDFLASMTA